MFKKKIIKILAILILASTSVMFTSCEEKDTNNISSEATTTTTEATTTTAAATTTTEATTTTSEATITTTAATTTTEASIESQETISADWKDMEFIFDNMYCKIPTLKYSDLVAKGWSFNAKDYGLDEGYVLNPNQKTYATISLKNNKYDEYLLVTFGFINNDTKVKDILECDVWSLTCNATPGKKFLENIPTFKLSGDITWGSSKEEIEAKYGKTTDIFEAKESGYVVYTYDIDNSKKMRLNIFNDGGLRSITLAQS